MNSENGTIEGYTPPTKQEQLEIALARAEHHIDELTQLLGACRDYCKELAGRIDRLIGPEQDDQE